MKTMKKVFLVVTFLVAFVCLFVLVGCDDVNVDKDGNDETVGIQIEGAAAFTESGRLIAKTTFTSESEIASTIETASGGMVTANMLSDSVVVQGSAIYKIELTEIPSGTDARAYLERVKREYAASLGSWTAFPNSPAFYSTQNGKDVVVFLDSSVDNAEIDVYVLYFESGAVSAIAARFDDQSGNGGSGGNGQQGNGQQGNGNVIYDGSDKTNQGGNEGGGENGGENGGEDDPNGEGDENGKDDQPPAYVRYTIVDVDKEGNQSNYMSDTVSYGAEFAFNWCDYVVFRDAEFKEEIDPNEKIEMTSDLTVYRRDNCDKVPVFVNIHYVVNGMERTDIVGFRTFFRGQIVTSSNLGGKEYEYYRGANGEKMFASGVDVIREEDDKLNIYGYREDPLYHKVTFKIGEKELGSGLAYEGTIFGRYSAIDYLGGGATQYEILDDPINVVTDGAGDFIVSINDYRVYHYFPITVHCCYKGDIKYSYVDYTGSDGEEVEISEEMNLYSDAECRSRFVGYITSAATFYSPISVDLS